MWIFNCDRCFNQDKNVEGKSRLNGEFAGTVTLAPRGADEEPRKQELCSECKNNLEWWFQKLDVVIPNVTLAPESPAESNSGIEGRPHDH